jgi:hypothetical protein
MAATTANDETFAKLLVCHTRNTVAQFLSQGNGLGKLANKGTSIPLECHYAEFVSLKMVPLSVIVRSCIDELRCLVGSR